MKMIPKSSRSQRREAKRAQEKQNKSQIFNKISDFEKIKQVLERYGWKYFSDYTDVTVINNENDVIGKSAALVLTNNDYSFTISEYGDGIRVGKMEIWKKTDNKIQEATILTANIINFLLNNGVNNIHAFTEFIGHIKEEDVVLNKVELEEMFLGLGFAKSGSRSHLRLIDASKLKKFDCSDNRMLLGNVENENTGENLVYFKGQTQVYFEFAGNQSKNFTRTFYVGTDAEIKSQLKNFDKGIKGNDEEAYMLKTTLKAVIEEDKAIPYQLLSHLAQSMIGVLLAKAAKENDYESKMTEIAANLIPLLHLVIEGNEKKHIQYRLSFNEKRETVDIASRSYDKKIA